MAARADSAASAVQGGRGNSRGDDAAAAEGPLVFAAYVASCAVASLLILTVEELLGVGHTVKIVTGSLLVAGAFMMVTWLCERRISMQLRLLLRERGHEVCVLCGYCLAGLGDDVKKCPECGAEREAMPEVKR